MRKWTQAELDAQRCETSGVLNLGTGDFRDCQFYGRSRMVIGPHSLIGDNAVLGTGCVIGEGCTIGEGFSSREFLHIGENCHFGAKAHIGFGSMISAGCCFGEGCEIREETLIREGVELPRSCTVYGVAGVDGRTMLRMGPIAGRALYAFEVAHENGTRVVWAGCTGVAPAPLKEFMTYTESRARNHTFGLVADDTWKRLYLAATYVYSHFAAAIA